MTISQLRFMLCLSSSLRIAFGVSKWTYGGSVSFAYHDGQISVTQSIVYAVIHLHLWNR